MLELGPEASALHAACGRRMAERGATVVVGVRGVAGELVRAAREEGVDAVFVEDAEAAGRWLKENIQSGDAVLLKASRGVRLERALAGLTAE
jgi:UDP-N-acetylmuramoyl-tripeptide--D-alanyl-D-alanine ligase